MFLFCDGKYIHRVTQVLRIFHKQTGRSNSNVCLFIDKPSNMNRKSELKSALIETQCTILVPCSWRAERL